MELPLLFVLSDLEAAGIAVDVDHFGTLEEGFSERIRAAAEAAYEVIGEQINLGSPKQLQTVLFDKLEMPKTKKTKTGYTTDADALQTLYEKTEHPFLAHLLEHRDATRLKVTVDGLLKSVADDGRIHTTFNQTVAATGRLSSTEPNLQNIPVRTEAGREIRHGFVVGRAEDGTPFDCLMTADYSQIEMRIMAHLSEDAADRGVQHRRGSPQLRRVPRVRRADRRGDHRDAPPRQGHVVRTCLRAQRFRARRAVADQSRRGQGTDGGLFRPVRWGARLPAQRRRRGAPKRVHRNIVRPPTLSPDLNSDNWQRRQAAERMALNAPIQGTAADIIKVAMINVHKRLTAEELRSRMLLQVHDELVIEVADGERDQVETVVREEMGNAITLSVPLEVSVGYGRSWDDAAH